MASPKSRLLLFWLLVVVGCAVDLATKEWIFARLGLPPRDTIWIVPGAFSLTTSLNEGALFGLGQGWTSLFAALSVVAAIGIVGWLLSAGGSADLRLTIALGCILAGIAGNLYDRLGLHGLVWPPGHERAGQRVFAVRDWLHFKWWLIDWPVFNVADSLLVCGAALIFWVAWRPAAAERPPAACGPAGQAAEETGDGRTDGGPASRPVPD
jgi:signal peptidase II